MVVVEEDEDEVEGEVEDEEEGIEGFVYRVTLAGSLLLYTLMTLLHPTVQCPKESFSAPCSHAHKKNESEEADLQQGPRISQTSQDVNTLGLYFKLHTPARPRLSTNEASLGSNTIAFTAPNRF